MILHRPPYMFIFINHQWTFYDAADSIFDSAGIRLGESYLPDGFGGSDGTELYVEFLWGRAE